MLPRNPSMALTSTRIGTFFHGWSPVRASPREIASAGFYFLGVRDRVKCWYCDGGLQNWEFEDEPWHEHAKWFPTCPFLLEKKGPEYISGVAEMYPGIKRPRLRFRVTRPSRTLTPAQSYFTPQSPQTSGSDLQTSQTTDPDPQSTQGPDSNPQSPQSSDSNPQSPQSSDSNPQTTLDQPSHDSARGCKICFSAKAVIAFVPCGHICACVNCSERLFHCPLCRTLITTSVRVYIP